jgi:hypothetical protein
MGAAVPLVIVLALLASSGCITRPGMNRDCCWPSESRTHLDLSTTNNRRHLVIDAERIEALLDRDRFLLGQSLQRHRIQV